MWYNDAFQRQYLSITLVPSLDGISGKRLLESSLEIWCDYTKVEIYRELDS